MELVFSGIRVVFFYSNTPSFHTLVADRLRITSCGIDISARDILIDKIGPVSRVDACPDCLEKSLV